METIKVLIVEDKAMIAENIAMLLQKHAMEVAGICESGEDAITLVRESPPDLILMDIELAGAMDGISAAKIIQEIHPVPIIYLTDHTDPRTFDRAKKTHPAQYIGKPFLEPDLVRAIDLAFTNANTTQPVPGRRLLRDHVFLKDKHTFIKLAYQEILFLKADRSYCDVIIDNKPAFKLSSNMNHIFGQIGHEDFVRVHRSYVINAGRITSIDGNMIKIGDHTVQMSHDYRDELMGRVKIIK
jgi:DNA-binding LytR/AlgR family response regulator